MVQSQGSQKARTWQRPLEWNIPISLPVSVERLEWNPVHRVATERLGSGEEEAGAANFSKKLDSEGVRGKRMIQADWGRGDSVRKRIPKCFNAEKKAAVEREIEEIQVKVN